MTEEEFQSDLLASSASRAEAQGCSLREGFITEVLERLRDADEAPDWEICSETLVGRKNRRLEIDAWADDEADGSLHLFIGLFEGAGEPRPKLALTEAKEQAFVRLLNVFIEAREGWIVENTEESRPLWELGRHIQKAARPTALRLHILTDRAVSERIREIPGDRTVEEVPVTFQIWDVTRLKRISDAQSIRDDLIVDFSNLPGGGLPALVSSANDAGYDGYLAVIPGEVLADLYVRHGSRLLEGNVRTFLGRSRKVNKGIIDTVSGEPEKFFAFNNGIATTASGVETTTSPSGQLLLTSVTDLQIVNGAQTTVSIVTALKERKLRPGTIFVPMKLSVIAPAIANDMIPLISKFANSQNGVRPSDFFANHPFHRRMEGISRRIMAPTQPGSQIQTHWYYERARGQYLNDQAGLTTAEKTRFELMNPRRQIISKTDLAKVECCFALEPDVACKGAEKAFVTFADRVAREWVDEGQRSVYSDEWFKSAVVRVMLFRETEAIVSKAPWYEGGYRAQIVAYACARLAHLARDRSADGELDYQRIWSKQSIGSTLAAQMELIAKEMLRVLRSPPVSGQNVTEWAKQQACRKVALEARVEVLDEFDQWLMSAEDRKKALRGNRQQTGTDAGIEAQKQVLQYSSAYWLDLKQFCETKGLLQTGETGALFPACQIPKMVPTEIQARKLLRLVARAEAAGWQWNN